MGKKYPQFNICNSMHQNVRHLKTHFKIPQKYVYLTFLLNRLKEDPSFTGTINKKIRFPIIF